MIPDFDEHGLLPPGIHDCTWDQFRSRFGTNRHRRELLSGLRSALIDFKQAGCARAYIDGSFVTDKRAPADFDGCWDPVGVDPSKLDSVFTDLGDLANGRVKQKAKYRGEMFPSNALAQPIHRVRFVDFFQQTRGGDQKGIIAIDLTQEFS